MTHIVKTIDDLENEVKDFSNQEEREKDLKQNYKHWINEVGDRVSTKLEQKDFYKRVTKYFKKKYKEDFRRRKEIDNFDTNILCQIFLLMFEYKNQVSQNLLLKCLEYFIKFIPDIDKKVLVIEFLCEFDFKDESTRKRFHRLLNNIEKKGINFIKFQKRFTEFSNLVNPKNSQYTIQENKDLNYISSNDWIEIYRGFTVPKDLPIKFQNIPIKFQKFKFFQVNSFGNSFTLDKKLAYCFAHDTRNQISKFNCNKEEIKKKGFEFGRSTIGRYLIKRERIIAYNNSRNEREIIANPADAFLIKYEFVSNLSGETIFDDTIKGSVWNSYTNAITKIKSNHKIHKIFNKKLDLKKYSQLEKYLINK